MMEKLNAMPMMDIEKTRDQPVFSKMS